MLCVTVEKQQDQGKGETKCSDSYSIRKQKVEREGDRRKDKQRDVLQQNGENSGVRSK